MNREKEQLLSSIDLPRVRRMSEHKKHLRSALLLAHQERSGSGRFGYAINDIIKTMSTLQKGFAFSVLTLAMIVGTAGIFGPSASSVANAQAQETINRAYARLAHFSDEERAGLFKQVHGEGVRMAIRSSHDADALTEILAEAQAAPDLQIVSADEVPVYGFFGRVGRTFGFKMVRKIDDNEKRLALLPQGVQEEAREHIALVGEHKKPATFMVYTNFDGNTVYLGINEDDEPIFVLIANGNLPTDGDRVMIESENGEPEDGGKMYLRSEGDTLPGGEGKQLFNEDNELIVR